MLWSEGTKTSHEPAAYFRTELQCVVEGRSFLRITDTHLLPGYTYYPEFCNLNSDRGKKSKSLSSFVGGPIFYGAGAERVTNYKNRACRSILMVCTLINIKVTRYVKQHMFVSTVFSYQCRFCKDLHPLPRQDKTITLTQPSIL